MYTFINKIESPNGCYKTQLNFGNNIIPEKEKTFFPPHWSQEKVIQTIFEASQNRIEDLSDQDNPLQKFLCKVNSFFIEIVINNKNIITSAYPSKKNFRI